MRHCRASGSTAGGPSLRSVTRHRKPEPAQTAAQALGRRARAAPRTLGTPLRKSGTRCPPSARRHPDSASHAHHSARHERPPQSRWCPKPAEGTASRASPKAPLLDSARPRSAPNRATVPPKVGLIITSSPNASLAAAAPEIRRRGRSGERDLPRRFRPTQTALDGGATSAPDRCLHHARHPLPDPLGIVVLPEPEANGRRRVVVPVGDPPQPHLTTFFDDVRKRSAVNPPRHGGQI